MKIYHDWNIAGDKCYICGTVRTIFYSYKVLLKINNLNTLLSDIEKLVYEKFPCITDDEYTIKKLLE